MQTFAHTITSRKKTIIVLAIFVIVLAILLITPPSVSLDTPHASNVTPTLILE